MQAVWVSLSANVKCACKHSVEALNPGDTVKFRTRPSPEQPAGRTSTPGTNMPRRRHSGQRDQASTQFVGLSIGDTSRNIVEMIYQAAVRDLEGPIPVVSQVFRVYNPIETRKRFEEHRDVIKKRECDKKDNRHPRVLADGNELLQFYSTTISRCCTQTNQRAALCTEFSCGVCRTIQRGFEMECKEKKGIVFSASGESLHGVSSENGRRAVIVCRTIAGVLGSMKEINEDEACDSVRSTAGSKLDYLILRNPRAVLPCFVIVFEK